MMRIARFLLPVFLFLLVLAEGCHKSANHTSDPGTPPTITAGPTNATTVSGRPVTVAVTAAGAPELRFLWAKDGVNILGANAASWTLFDPQPADSGSYTVTITNPNGTITSPAAVITVVPALSFTAPMGVVADATGNIYVSDRDDHVIWKVDPAQQVTLLAGTLSIPGSSDGQGTNASFRNPGSLALDPSGNLVVADTGNHTIRRVAMDGTVTTLAGQAGTPGAADGLGTTLARFNAPFGLAVTSTGGIYIADSQNHAIRFLATDGTVSTYAGTSGQPGHTDAGGASARFNQPNGLALAANGTLYVADYGSSCIRVISPSAQVSTLAGIANSPGYANGTATTTQFNLPVGIALDAIGNLWVSDSLNSAIRRIASDGSTNTVAGSGTLGNADGSGTAALFYLPCGITSTPSGNFVVADTRNHMLRMVTPAGVVTTL